MVIHDSRSTEFVGWFSVKMLCVRSAKTKINNRSAYAPRARKQERRHFSSNNQSMNILLQSNVNFWKKQKRSMQDNTEQELLHNYGRRDYRWKVVLPHRHQLQFQSLQNRVQLK
jgi:hypothetical protein